MFAAASAAAAASGGGAPAPAAVVVVIVVVVVVVVVIGGGGGGHGRVVVVVVVVVVAVVVLVVVVVLDTTKTNIAVVIARSISCRTSHFPTTLIVTARTRRCAKRARFPCLSHSTRHFVWAAWEIQPCSSAQRFYCRCALFLHSAFGVVHACCFNQRSESAAVGCREGKYQILGLLFGLGNMFFLQKGRLPFSKSNHNEKTTHFCGHFSMLL